jgi:hypothetical protein
MQPKKVFISYSHKDEDAMRELDKFLGPLEKDGKITIWTDRKILPGQNWKNIILKELEDADLTLLLVSANFLDSDFIDKEEIPRAFQRMNEHGKHVVPIILNYCLWDHSVLKVLQAIPKDGKPIASYSNPSQAWNEVARAILGLLDIIQHDSASVSMQPSSLKDDTNKIRKEDILALIDQDLDHAFLELDRLFQGKNPTYTSLCNEYIDRPRDFTLPSFISRLKVFVTRYIN